MLTEKIKKYILKYKLIEAGDLVVVGFSGGPDSACLLHSLNELKGALSFRLHAVHVNHMLRGEHADRDAIYAKQFCNLLEIPCDIFSVEIAQIAKEKKQTLEEAGREARYAAMHAVKERCNGDKIAVAQNLNDQAETILMRLMRGTGTDGLAGMEPIRDGYIIRPLLDVSREEIESYCEEHKLNPVTDETNLSPIYTRNQIRLELLPYIEAHFNPNIIPTIGRLAQIAREDKAYFYKNVEAILSEHVVFEGGRAVLPIAVLKAQHPAIQKRLISRIFAMLGLEQDIAAIHIENALSIIEKEETSKRTNFPNGYDLKIAYGTIEFQCQKAMEENIFFSYPINLDGVTTIPELNASIRAKIIDRMEMKEIMQKQFVQCLDFDQIRSNLSVRNRRAGDRFVPSGMDGTKKLKKFLIDEKIPQEKRGRIPLICSGNDVLWVVGVRTSEKFRVSEGTKRVLLLEYSTDL